MQVTSAPSIPNGNEETSEMQVTSAPSIPNGNEETSETPHLFDPQGWKDLKFDSLPPTPPKKKEKAQKKQNEDIQWGGVRAKEAEDITRGVKLSSERFGIQPKEQPCLKVDHRQQAKEIALMFRANSTAQPALATEPPLPAPNIPSPLEAVEQEAKEDTKQKGQAAEPAHKRPAEQTSPQDTTAAAQGTPAASTSSPAEAVEQEAKEDAKQKGQAAPAASTSSPAEAVEQEAKEDAKQEGQAAEPAHKRPAEQTSRQDTTAAAQGTPAASTSSPAEAVEQEAKEDAKQEGQAAEPAHKRPAEQTSRQDTTAAAQGTPAASTSSPAEAVEQEAKEDAKHEGQAAEPAHKRPAEQTSPQDTTAAAQGTTAASTSSPAEAVEDEAKEGAKQESQAAEPTHKRPAEQTSRQDTTAAAQGTPAASTSSPAEAVEQEAKEDAKHEGQAAEPAHKRPAEQTSPQDTTAAAQGTPAASTSSPAEAVEDEAKEDASQKKARVKCERATASHPSNEKSLAKKQPTIKREPQEKQPLLEQLQETSSAPTVSTEQLAHFFSKMHHTLIQSGNDNVDIAKFMRQQLNQLSAECTKTEAVCKKEAPERSVKQHTEVGTVDLTSSPEMKESMVAQRKRKHKEQQPTDTTNTLCPHGKKPKTEPTTPRAAKTPPGIRKLLKHFAGQSVQRLQRRREVVNALTAASPDPSPEDISLPSRILDELQTKSDSRKASAEDEKNAEEEEEKNEHKQKQAACILLRDEQLSFLQQHGCLLQTYTVDCKKIQELNLILSEDSGSKSILVGTCQVATSVPLHLLKHLPARYPQVEAWKRRWKNGLSIYIWKITKLQIRPSPVPLRLTHSKHRNRHFFMEKEILENGFAIDVPSSMSLHSTSGFFLKLLSPKDYSRLRETAQNLNGYKLRVGTTCSGSEVGIVAVKSVLRAINREFNDTGLKLINIYICKYIFLKLF